MRLAHAPLGFFTRVKTNEVLNLDALQPGDIILSRELSGQSLMIAILGLSRYSHASLVVGPEVPSPQQAPAWSQPNLIVIEATNDDNPFTKKLVGGVGYWSLDRQMIRKRGSKERPMHHVMPLSGYAQFDVYRHSDAGTDAFRTFAEKGIPASCDQYTDKPYASLDAISRASFLPKLVRFIGRIRWLVDFPPCYGRGMFCSQLVATIFKEGGFSLSGKDPSLVRPRDIANCPFLAKVPNVRFRLSEDKELVTTAALINEALTNSSGKSTFDPEMVRAIFEDEPSPRDFHGRLTKWHVRDRLAIAEKHQRDVIEDLRKLNTEVKNAFQILEDMQREIDSQANDKSH